MPLFFKKIYSEDAQHILEYIAIITIAAIAVIIIGPYVVRSWNANVKSWEDSVTDTFNDPLIETNGIVPVLDCPSEIACATAQLDIGAGLRAQYDRACPEQIRNPGCPALYSGNPERKCEVTPSGSNWVQTENYINCVKTGCALQCGLDIGSGLTGCFGPANNGETYTISECGSGYTGSPTYTCSFGTWVNLQNPCISSCGNGICEDTTEGENCTICPGDCICPAGTICVAGQCCVAGTCTGCFGSQPIGGWALNGPQQIIEYNIIKNSLVANGIYLSSDITVSFRDSIAHFSLANGGFFILDAIYLGDKITIVHKQDWIGVSNTICGSGASNDSGCIYVATWGRYNRTLSWCPP